MRPTFSNEFVGPIAVFLLSERPVRTFDHCGATDLPKFDFGLSDQQIKWHAKRGRNCFERRCRANLLAGLDVGNEALPEAGSLAKLVLRQSAPFADGRDRILAPPIACQTEVGSATSSPRAILAEVASTMRFEAMACVIGSFRRDAIHRGWLVDYLSGGPPKGRLSRDLSLGNVRFSQRCSRGPASRLTTASGLNLRQRICRAKSCFISGNWSGQWESNPRHTAWEGL
jgi:hypothetical protein